MGAGSSLRSTPNLNGFIASSTKTNKKIEKQLALEKKKEQTVMKVLCLGTSNSGKSTFLKQMRILHLDGFDRKEKEIFRDSFMFTFITSANELFTKVPMSALTEDLAQIRNRLLHFVHSTAQSIKYDTENIKTIMDFFRSDDGYDMIDEYGNGEQHGNFVNYFLSRIDDLDEFGDFLPTTDDILRIRVQTTGVAFTNFTYKKAQFCMIDVGGQKSERRKWIHLFDDVKAILFITDISNFPGMNESLDVFATICETKTLAKASIILLFNKTDIFRDKSDIWELAKYFPDFAEKPCNHKEAGLFIQKKFEDTFRKRKTAEFYSFFTCATDTRNIDRTFSACTNIILKTSLAAAGLY